MVKLNRFITNSDFDSLKLASQQSWTVTIPETTIGQGDEPTYTYNFIVPDAVYFELLSVEHSDYPGYIANGSDLAFSVPYDSGNTLAVYRIYCGKTANTNFRVLVNLSRIWKPASPATTTFHTVTLKIKLNLLVPSEQQ